MRKIYSCDVNKVCMLPGHIMCFYLHPIYKRSGKIDNNNGEEESNDISTMSPMVSIYY